MTINEAICYLEGDLIINSNTLTSAHKEAIDLSIRALRRMEHREAIDIDGKTYCATCRKEVAYGDTYCIRCGQALKYAEV